MKKGFKPLVVKHTVEDVPVWEPDENGEMVHVYSKIVISGPGLPGIDYPYEDSSLPTVLQKYSLADLLSVSIEKPKKLWGNYWQSGQLCIMAGDMGVGKSTLAIQLAKALAVGTGLLDKENEMPPQKVLFVGFELSARDVAMRYGSGDVAENFMCANLNADAFASGRSTAGERLINQLGGMVDETGAEVVIIDQPDRLHLTPGMWNYFMLKLNELKVRKGLSILLTLNNKPRNLSKAPTVGSIYKSNLLAPHADSIITVAPHCRTEGLRYIKILKNNGGPLALNTLPDVFEIVLQNDCFLLQPRGNEQEEKVLLPTAAERRNTKIMKAERMWREGMELKAIAEAMELPERTVRRWVYVRGLLSEI